LAESHVPPRGKNVRGDSLAARLSSPTRLFTRGSFFDGRRQVFQIGEVFRATAATFVLLEVFE
jgi:hypothetical protein